MTSIAKQASRQEFEKWAAEVYGGNVDRFLIRDNQNLEKYRAADVQCAWDAWQAALSSAGVGQPNKPYTDAVNRELGDLRDKWNAAERRVGQLVEALQAALDLVWEHHEIGHIRRSYVQGAGSCELCKGGRYERLAALAHAKEQLK